MPHAECEIDNRIGVEVAQRDRARQGRTGQRRVDLGDLDRALGPPPGAIESYGHVRRIAELRFVGGVIRQRSQALPTGSASLRIDRPACGSTSVSWRSPPRMPAMSQAVAGELTLTPAGPARAAAPTASRRRPGHVAAIMSACSRTP